MWLILLYNVSLYTVSVKCKLISMKCTFIVGNAIVSAQISKISYSPPMENIGNFHLGYDF